MIIASIPMNIPRSASLYRSLDCQNSSCDLEDVVRKLEAKEVPHVPEGSTRVQQEVFVEEESVPDTKKCSFSYKYVMRIYQMVLCVLWLPLP